MKGRSADEIEEVQAEKEAKTRAILLEMVNISIYLLDVTPLGVRVIKSSRMCTVYLEIAHLMMMSWPRNCAIKCLWYSEKD